MKKFPKKILVFFISFLVLLFSNWGIQSSTLIENKNFVANAEIPPVVEERNYSLIELKGKKVLFINRVDGYGVTLPETMKVTEANSTDIRMVLEDEHRRMEIYKQPVSGVNASAEGYISYSNYFLQNTADHRLELQTNTKINGYPAKITQWFRGKLLRVENDKNYYACVDIITQDYVYTFFIKSDLPFAQCGGYLELTKGFYTLTPTVSPTSLRFRQTENKFWDAETKEFYARYFGEDSNLLWGIFKYSAPQDMSELKALESKLDYDFRFILVYKHLQKEYPPNYVRDTLQNAYNNGKTVELTLQTTSQEPGEGNMVYDVLDGKYDSFLQEFARETAEFGHPVLFRLGNEMNGDWCQYSGYHTSRDPEVYKELYRYVYKIFQAVEADNVIWVWNPNERSFPDFKWNNEVLYYPGDEYVDVVGLTGYNNGTYYKGEIWRSFTEIYDPLYEEALRLSEKPLMITEFSSSSVGGNKEEWVRNMFANLNKYPLIKVAIWWDGCDWDKDGNIARPYFINESEELMGVFKENLRDYK